MGALIPDGVAVCGCPSVVVLSWGAVIHGALPVRCSRCPRLARVVYVLDGAHVCTRCHAGTGP